MSEPVNVTVDDLFKLLGMKEAELAVLRAQLEHWKAAATNAIASAREARGESSPPRE